MFLEQPLSGPAWYRVSWKDRRGRRRAEKFPAGPRGLREALSFRRRLPMNAGSRLELVMCSTQPIAATVK